MISKSKRGCNIVFASEPQHALTLYEKMEELELDPAHISRRAIIALLKDCTKRKCIKLGSEIHAHLARIELLQADQFTSSTLVDMYAKCGALAKAQEVFDRIPNKNAVSWNVLMTAYAQYGFGQQVIDQFEQMQVKGIAPDPFSFTCILKACGSIGAIDKGQAMHNEIKRHGLLYTDVVVASAIIDMYIKCGSITEARGVFDDLAFRDVIAWTTIIAGYTDQDFGAEALKCFDRMQSEGILPDIVTFICSLKACCSLGIAENAKQIHCKICMNTGLNKEDQVVGNVVVDVYARCGLLTLAENEFEKLLVRDIVSWNSMIAAYARNGQHGKVTHCLEQMHLEGISPNEVTFVCILKVCTSAGAIHKFQHILDEIEKQDILERDVLVGNAFVDLYVKCGNMHKAQELFNKLPSRNVTVWTSLIMGFINHGLGVEALKCIDDMLCEGVFPDRVLLLSCLKACASTGDIQRGKKIHYEIEKRGLLETDISIGTTLISMYAKCGLLANAYELLDKLPVRNVVSWTALVSSYAEQGYAKEALECLEQMSFEDISPDDVMASCSLKACGNIGASEKGKEIHAELERKGLIEKDPVIGVTLVDMYGKCGSPSFAHEVFDKIVVHDVTSWNTLISNYAQFGDIGNVFYVFEEMLKKSIKPDAISFMIVLGACSQTYIFDKSLTLFEAMTKVYGITPTLEHHACMVDLFGRLGQIDSALSMIQQMPSCPDLAVWNTVLGACRNGSNLTLGKRAFEYAMCVNKNHAGIYVLMSHICSGI